MGPRSVVTAAGSIAIALAAAAQQPPAAATAAGYRDAAARLIEAAKGSGKGYEVLQHLTDRIGPRLSGSEQAAEAVRWTAEHLRRQGLAVSLDPFPAPRWVRGVETGEILAPARQKLALTALGESPPTPEHGVSAEVVEVASLEALDALGEARVRGKIVLFNRVMKPGWDGPETYGAVGALRGRGPAQAARLGAVAALVRSLGTLSARLPHTGGTDFPKDGPEIPAAAVAAEDAELIHRLLASGEPVKVQLVLGCRRLPDVESANVVADLRGRERPDEIVVIGAHLDSWDLGTGAVDDGAGVAMVIESLRLMKSLGLAPRRTVRGILYMSEEIRATGGRAHAESHRAELGRYVAAIEADAGGAPPVGFTAGVGPGGLELLAGIAGLLKGLGADPVQAGYSGADIEPLRALGQVPVLGLRLDGTHYFDWHHTPGDTLDKVDPAELAQGAAAMAVMAYVLADMPGTLARPPAEAAH